MANTNICLNITEYRATKRAVGSAIDKFSNNSTRNNTIANENIGENAVTPHSNNADIDNEAIWTYETGVSCGVNKSSFAKYGTTKHLMRLFLATVMLLPLNAYMLKENMFFRGKEMTIND